MKIFNFTILFLQLTSISVKVSHSDFEEPKRFSGETIIIKTSSPLRISEATGKISLNTGVFSLDEKFVKFGVKSIDRVFEINNGDPELFFSMQMDRIYVLGLESNEHDRIEEMVKEFSSEDIVEYSEPNYIGHAAGEKGKDKTGIGFSEEFIPNDRYFYKQWYLKNDGSIKPSGRVASKVGADINMTHAWNIEKGSEDVIIAILDSGIRDDHPDLRRRIWINKNEIPNNGIDDDNNGYIDDYKGWDFAYDTKDNYDGFGHGTNIASVIGAETNNRIGFAGVDQRAKLMNCKNLSDDNYGEYIWWSRSIKYAVDNGADIINMSEGGDDYSKTLETAVEYAFKKGVMIVAAMMNRGDDKDYYPASFDGVFAVGATDSDDRRSKRFSWGGGSCFGNHISVVAPGNKIYGLDYEDINNYDVYWSGTSQSTAIVSAIASLLLAQDNYRTRSQLMDIIKKTAIDQVGDPKEDKPGWDVYHGFGRVDAYLALLYGVNPELALKLKNSGDYRGTLFESRKEEVAAEDNNGIKAQPQKPDLKRPSPTNDTSRDNKPNADKPLRR